MAVLRVSRPVLRAGSRYVWFRQRIPQDMLQHPILRAGGLALSIPVGNAVVNKRLSAKAVDVALSLQTPHGSEGGRRFAVVASYLENVWAALRRAQPVNLSHRQATALAGELYRAWAESGGWTVGLTHRPDGGGKLKGKGGQTWDPIYATAEQEQGIFTAALSRLAATPEERLETQLGPLADRLLLAKGIAALDAESRPVLLRALLRAFREALDTRQRNAGGDYAADPVLQRFPAWTVIPSLASSSSPLSLSDLLERWWAEAKATGRKQATYLNYARAIRALCVYLKHDDAGLVTADDIVGFKGWRLATVSPQSKKLISPLTVRGNELGGLKTIFAFAVANKLLPTNPALGVTLSVGNPQRLRSKGFDDGEAKALLKQAHGAKRRGNEMAATAAARRWVPWLLAYTGARVGEMCQLRKGDVRLEGKHWTLTISPEAGTVKDDRLRKVPLHPHLIEQGFVSSFVNAAPPGHLFLKVGPDGRVGGVLKGLKTRLAYCAREVVTDPKVAPNHGWRHRFKSVGMEVGIPPRVLDAVQGHSPRTAGEGYGEASTSTMAAAIAKLPRYVID